VRPTTSGAQSITKVRSSKRCHKETRSQRCAEILEESNEATRPAGNNCHGLSSLVRCGDERHRKCATPTDRPLAEQSGRKLTSAISTTRTRDGEVQTRRITSEVCLDPLFNPQSCQSGTPPPQTPRLQTHPERDIGRVASTRRLISCDRGTLWAGSNCSDNARLGA